MHDHDFEMQVSDYRKKRVHHGRQGGADQVEAEDSRRGQVGQEQAEVGEGNFEMGIILSCFKQYYILYHYDIII